VRGGAGRARGGGGVYQAARGGNPGRGRGNQNGQRGGIGGGMNANAPPFSPSGPGGIKRPREDGPQQGNAGKRPRGGGPQ